MNTTRASVSALLVLGLLLSLLVATQSVSADPADPACESYDSGANASSTCDVTGRWTQIGHNNFEPTMGVTPEGGLYMATTPGRGVAVGWRAGVAKAESLDSAFTSGGWTDVQPTIAGYSNPPETNDPYAYVDPSTGRIFSFHMSPILLCSILSFSDDGGETWTTPPVGCGPSGAWDHQTMVAAPPTPGTVMLGDYPNVLIQCVNSVYAEMCARSLDGGLTWGAGYPAYPNPSLTGAGTQTGHLAAGSDGTIYLPSPNGGNQASIYVSDDSGLTWTEREITDMDIPFSDPAIDLDAAGVLHVTWIDTNNHLWYALSTDKAVTFTEPVRVTSTGVHAELPALVAGDAGRVATASAGTRDLPNGYDTDVAARDVSWGAYIAVTDTAIPGQSPTFDIVNTTGDDPIQRGTSCSSRCLFLVDFIDVVVTPDGTPVAAFSDGCDNAACIDGTASNNVTDRGKGMIAVADFDLCETTCHHFTPAEAGQSPLLGAVLPAAEHVGFEARDVLGDARYEALLQAHLDELGFTPAE